MSEVLAIAYHNSKLCGKSKSDNHTQDVRLSDLNILTGNRLKRETVTQQRISWLNRNNVQEETRLCIISENAVQHSATFLLYNQPLNFPCAPSPLCKKTIVFACV